MQPGQILCNRPGGDVPPRTALGALIGSADAKIALIQRRSEAIYSYFTGGSCIVRPLVLYDANGARFRQPQLASMSRLGL